MTEPRSREALPLRSRPGYLIRRLQQLTISLFYDAMGDLPLTPVQSGALTAIADRPGIDQSELGAELGTDRANTAGIVARLIKNGLVTRTVSTRDRRSKQLRLTGEGTVLLQATEARMKDFHTRLLGPLDEEEREVFMRLLMRLITEHNDQGRTVLKL